MDRLDAGRRQALSLALLSLLAGRSQASDKPIEWVVGFAPGGASDVLARLLAEAMGAELGRTIIVVNKPGAATNIAADYVAKHADVGNVLLTADMATLAANPWLYRKLPYDAQRDLAPVGLIGRIPLLLVVGSAVPAKNYSEFLAWAKGQKDPIPFATPGAGSPHHLAGELFRQQTGLRMLPIHYRGGGPAVQDMLAGQVPMFLLDSATAYPHLQGGKLRALGSATLRRTASLPDLPTLSEQGMTNFEVYAWQGLAVQAKTSPELVASYGKALRSALDKTAVKARLQVLGVEPLRGTADDMRRYVEAERARWGQIIESTGIKLD